MLDSPGIYEIIAIYSFNNKNHPNTQIPWTAWNYDSIVIIEQKCVYVIEKTLDKRHFPKSDTNFVLLNGTCK